MSLRVEYNSTGTTYLGVTLAESLSAITFNETFYFVFTYENDDTEYTKTIRDISPAPMRWNKFDITSSLTNNYDNGNYNTETSKFGASYVCLQSSYGDISDEFTTTDTITLNSGSCSGETLNVDGVYYDEFHNLTYFYCNPGPSCTGYTYITSYSILGQNNIAFLNEGWYKYEVYKDSGKETLLEMGKMYVYNDDTPNTNVYNVDTNKYVYKK